MAPSFDRPTQAVSAPHLCRNRAQAADIRAHLLACAESFTPPLAGRVSIPDYAQKLFARAERFEVWAGAALIGLVALYCDAPDRGEAFVTNVSVVPEHARRGLGRGLLRAAVGHAGDLGFGRVALHVDRAAPALGLYRTLGFEVAARAGETLHLSLALRQTAVPGGPGANGC